MLQLISQQALEEAFEKADSRKATKSLLFSLFGKKVLQTHTLGQVQGKAQLDPQKVKAIIGKTYQLVFTI